MEKYKTTNSMNEAEYNLMFEAKASNIPLWWHTTVTCPKCQRKTIEGKFDREEEHCFKCYEDEAEATKRIREGK